MIFCTQDQVEFNIPIGTAVDVALITSVELVMINTELE